MSDHHWRINKWLILKKLKLFLSRISFFIKVEGVQNHAWTPMASNTVTMRKMHPVVKFSDSRSSKICLGVFFFTFFSSYFSVVSKKPTKVGHFRQKIKLPILPKILMVPLKRQNMYLLIRQGEMQQMEIMLKIPLHRCLRNQFNQAVFFFWNAETQILKGKIKVINIH